MLRYAILAAAAGKQAGNRRLIPKPVWQYPRIPFLFSLAAAFSYPVIIVMETGN